MTPDDWPPLDAPAPFPNPVCWDRESRPKVTNTIALDVVPAVFHATHSPSHLLRGGAAPGTFVGETERGFLADFLSDQYEQRLALAVGESGAGKSHFIRWAYFELARRNGLQGNRWHVVLVPRSSANLYDVVGQVLRGFTGPLVQSVQQELALARSKLTEAGARHRVLDELAFVLGDDNRPPHAGARPLTDDEREARGLLPAFLRDDAVRSWLIARLPVVARLGEHVAGTRTTLPPAPEELRWQADQLEVPSDVYSRTGERARELAGLLMTDEAVRPLVARLLNDAWADASAALLGLRRGNLGSALLEIRKELLTQGRQLILLLEDLSIARGVDYDLLEALIVRPNERPGEPLCVLRSIVGLTPEDYDSLQDNIRTEARSYPVHLTLPLTEQTAAAGTTVGPAELVSFAARYLNAARFPLALLRRWYEDEEARQQPLPSFCALSECPNRSSCHAAFGAAPAGATDGQAEYGLYPFTAEALLRLYEQAAGTRQPGPLGRHDVQPADAGRLGPQPRPRHGAEQTLSEARFPAAELLDQFKLKNVPAALQLELERRYPGQWERLRWALELYGPQRPELPPGVGRALDLPGPDEVRPPTDPATTPLHATIPPTPVVPAPVVAPPAPPPTEDNFDRWANEAPLEDKELNRWRGWAYDAICGAIDWDTEEGLTPLASLFKRTYIHFEGQFVNQLGDVRLLVPRSAHTAVAMRALSRLQGSRLNFEEAGQELNRCQAQVERWADEVRRQFRERVAAVHAGSPSAREYAALLLALGAVLRGAVSPTADEAELLARAVEDWPEEVPEQRQPAWRSLWREYQRHAGSVRDFCKDWLACPKGARTDAGLMDPSPVLAALRQFRRTGQVPPLPPEAEGWPKDSHILDLAAALVTHRRPALDQEKQACTVWLQEVQTWLGGQEPRELLKGLEPVLQLAEEVGVLTGSGALQLADRLRGLSRKALKKALEVAGQAAQATEEGRLLAALAGLDTALMHDLREALRDAGSVLAATALEVETQIGRLSGGDDTAVKAARADAGQQLTELLGLFNALLRERTDAA